MWRRGALAASCMSRKGGLGLPRCGVRCAFAGHVPLDDREIRRMVELWNSAGMAVGGSLSLSILNDLEEILRCS